MTDTVPRLPVRTGDPDMDAFEASLAAVVAAASAAAVLTLAPEYQVGAGTALAVLEASRP